ncbi:MAG: site-specific integrase [Bacteroidales bacterium]|nr:site-specific integrase [Bacteroidales bacterium]
MATVKVKFQPSAIPGHEGTIYYRIIHERKTRHLFTGYKVFPDEWDENRSTVTTSPGTDRKPLMQSIRRDMERLIRIGRKLAKGDISYSVDDVVDEFNRYVREYTLFNYMDSLIIKFRQNGKLRTAETYVATLNSFRKFLTCRQPSEDIYSLQKDIMLDCLTPEIMEEYEAWQQRRGVTPNTISFYIRIIRAVYNRAVRHGVIDDMHPFRAVYTGIEKTVKRALPLDIIKKIRMLDLSSDPSLDFARDMFMMSFYLRGMSFIDMAFLRKTDLKNDYVTYRRRKTNQQLTIAWTKEMQSVLNKYPENRSEYLLPIIKNPDINERSAYKNMGYNINHNLKSIARMVDVRIPLTLYVARHSWASAAKAKGVPLSVISDGMGHDSETTTRIYLASLDTTMVDEANALILSSLC